MMEARHAHTHTPLDDALDLPVGSDPRVTCRCGGWGSATMRKLLQGAQDRWEGNAREPSPRHACKERSRANEHNDEG
eukprot:583600-Pelagomonas_calceolata.AAC.4